MFNFIAREIDAAKAASLAEHVPAVLDREENVRAVPLVRRVADGPGGLWASDGGRDVAPVASEGTLLSLIEAAAEDEDVKAAAGLNKEIVALRKERGANAKKIEHLKVALADRSLSDEDREGFERDAQTLKDRNADIDRNINQRIDAHQREMQKRKADRLKKSSEAERKSKAESVESAKENIQAGFSDGEQAVKTADGLQKGAMDGPNLYSQEAAFPTEHCVSRRVRAVGVAGLKELDGFLSEVRLVSSPGQVSSEAVEAKAAIFANGLALKVRSLLEEEQSKADAQDEINRARKKNAEDKRRRADELESAAEKFDGEGMAAKAAKLRSEARKLRDEANASEEYVRKVNEKRRAELEKKHGVPAAE
jgi:hypothetical protein